MNWLSDSYSGLQTFNWLINMHWSESGRAPHCSGRKLLAINTNPQELQGILCPTNMGNYQILERRVSVSAEIHSSRNTTQWWPRTWFRTIKVIETENKIIVSHHCDHGLIHAQLMWRHCHKSNVFCSESSWFQGACVATVLDYSMNLFFSQELEPWANSHTSKARMERTRGHRS